MGWPRSDYAVLDGESHEGFATPTGFAGYSPHDPSGRETVKVEKIYLDGRGGSGCIAARFGPLSRKRSVPIPVRSASVYDGPWTLVLQ